MSIQNKTFENWNELKYIKQILKLNILIKDGNKIHFRKFRTNEKKIKFYIIQVHIYKFWSSNVTTFGNVKPTLRSAFSIRQFNLPL